MRLVLDARVAAEHFPGIGRIAADLGRALARAAAAPGPGGPPIEMAFLTARGQAGAFHGALPEPRIPVDDSPLSLGQQWGVPPALRRAGADAYHSLFYMMPLFAGVPTALSCMDLIPLVRPETQPAWKRALFAALYRAAIARADLLIAISESTRRDLAERLGVAPERVHVVPLACDERFRPVAEEVRAPILARHGLGRPYVLYVGSNKPHKNLAALLRAFAHVAGRARDESLVVAGVWDPRYEEPRRIAAELGILERVRFLGPIPDDDLPALYSGARTFVFPSFYEGFGLPVLEAMACGAPVIASGVSSLPEVTGDAGLAVDPASVDSITAALERMLGDEDLRATCARRGLERAAQFSWDRAARAHLALYREKLVR